MTGINVLSTGGPTKTKDGFSASEKSQQGLDSAAMDFAAILGGWIGQGSGQGQNSGIQSNDPAGKEANSGRNALLGLEGLQALIGTLQGYGNTQGVLVEKVQSEQKALEGANLKPGEVPKVLSSLDLVLAQLKREVLFSNPLGNVEEVNRAGKPELPQGDKSLQSELDLYKGIISELLKKMSGEIQEIMPEALPTSIQQKLELVVQRMNSGLFATPLDETLSQVASETTDESSQSTERLFSIQNTSRDLNINIKQSEGPVIPNALVNFLEEVLSNKSLREEPSLKETKTKTSSENLSVFSSLQDLSEFDKEQQGTTRAMTEQIIGQGNRLVNNPRREEKQISESELIRRQEINPIKPSSEEKVLNFGQFSRQEKALTKETLQEEGNSSQSFSDEKIDPQNSVVEGHGILNSTKEIVHMQTKIESKLDLPIWAQVARDIHEKAFHARPQLRELDINLHPAELGQIRISLTWEDGQVHLRMSASEVGTGQVLQSNFAELRENLSQSGIQCGMLEMGLGDQQKNSRQQQGQEQRSHSNPEDSQGLEGIHELDALSGAGSLESSSRINVTA